MVEYVPIKCPKLNARINSHRSHPIVVEALLEIDSLGDKKIYCPEDKGNQQCNPSENYPNRPLECLYSKEGAPL